MHPFAEYVNPHLADLLKKVDMDKCYVRGEGCYLYDSSGRRYLDLIASYGALPFGFNPPEIWAALEGVRLAGEPSFVQPSYLNAAGELAERLVSIAPPGLRYVTFTNSGAEAVEAAIKICRAATGRRRILSTRNSFHGKTLGALSATGKATYQRAFGAPVEGFDFVSYGDVQALDEALAGRGSEYAACILEPIQGEGGIVIPPEGYLRAARSLCDREGVLLIVDEVQTGLGRTGRYFACEEEGVTPDVLVVAKALGGGLMPVGAAIATEAAYTEEFGNKHSSTFGGNTLACRAGIAALGLLTRDGGAILENVRRNGALLLDGLREIQQRYPSVVREVRGRGLMIGVHFAIDRETFPDGMLGIMAEQELLTPLVSSYLLNVEGLRVAPTLNGSDVIRIEPPLIVTKEQCEVAVAGLERAVRILAGGSTAHLLRHLVPGCRLGEPPEPATVGVSVRGPKPAPSGDPSEGRFAFLVHPLDLRNYREFDESLEGFSEGELAGLSQRWNDLVDPFVLSTARIVSSAGASAYGEFIAIPRTSEELMDGPRDQIMGILRQAVALARDRGAKIVGLGAYTSVVSHGGLRLQDEGVAVTTGNSYTVASAVEAVALALKRLGLRPARSTVSVVGATGSIGRATAILMSEVAQRLVLVGNPKWPDRTRRRLLEVAAAACRHLAAQARNGVVFEEGTLGHRIASLGDLPPEEADNASYIALATELEDRWGQIILSCDADKHLPVSDVVVTATSSLATIVTPHNLKHGAVVCDLSRPANVSRDVREARPDVLVIDGGVIEVPGRPSLGWDFGFEEGLSYACMAETMMLALDHHYSNMSIGSDLNIADIMYTRRLAEAHGFRLADLRSFDRPLTAAEWERIIAARAPLAGVAAPGD